MHGVVRFVVLMFAASAGLCVQSMAASYPTKPVRLVVPLPPGGAADILARDIAPKLTAQLGQQVAIDNIPGGNGVVGFDAVAKAPADGYTLLLGSTTGIAVNPQLMRRIPYDPIRSYTPISLLARTPMVLVSGPGFKATSIQQLIAVAKASPGKISYGTPGAGTPGHLAGELFKLTAGIDLVHVPYKGATSMIDDVIGGQVPTGFVTLAAALPELRTGKLKALAITSALRSPAASTVPTTAESGLPSLVITEWFGILAPAATPKAVVSHLNQEINGALQKADIQARFGEQGFEPMTRTIDYFESLIKSDISQMAMIIKKAKIRGGDVTP